MRELAVAGLSSNTRRSLPHCPLKLFFDTYTHSHIHTHTYKKKEQTHNTIQRKTPKKKFTNIHEKNKQTMAIILAAIAIKTDLSIR